MYIIQKIIQQNKEIIIITNMDILYLYFIWIIKNEEKTKNIMKIFFETNKNDNGMINVF